MNDDMKLVREFAASESEQAFEALVTRHIPLVYSAALRRTNDPHLAEEITQAVFLILARKANSLGPGTILSGWLYRATQYAAADALKTERRRQKREQEAHMQSLLDDPQTSNAWNDLLPLLDEAMMRLRQVDRDAIVLCYFENKTLREVGGALGLQERAAQKRIGRALEKLRSFFAKRGVVLTSTLIGGAIAAGSVQAAPVHLGGSITAAVIKGSTVAASTLALVKGTLKIMSLLKLKTATITAAAVIVLGVATTVIVAQSQPPAPLAGQAEAEQQLKQLERDWSAAFLKHDPATISKILADDYVGIDGRGLIFDKARELQEAEPPKAGAPATSFQVLEELVTDMKVRLYGDVAVMHGRVVEKVKIGETQREIQFRRTTVWVKRQGSWQCVSFHGSRILEPGKQ